MIIVGRGSFFIKLNERSGWHQNDHLDLIIKWQEKIFSQKQLWPFLNNNMTKVGCRLAQKGESRFIESWYFMSFLKCAFKLSTPPNSEIICAHILATYYFWGRWCVLQNSVFFVEILSEVHIYNFFCLHNSCVNLWSIF